MDFFFDPRSRGRLWVALGNQPGVGMSFAVNTLARLWRRSDEARPEQETESPVPGTRKREAGA